MKLTDELRAKRVAIAEDVLKQIATHRIEPRHGAYLIADVEKGATLDVDQNTQLEFLLSQVKGSCVVCAAGALLFSRALLYDEIPAIDFLLTDGPGDPHIGSQLHPAYYLSDIFDHSEVKEIEKFFEGWANYYDAVIRYPEPPDRLAAMMKNIIGNNGVFQPRELLFR